MYDKLATVPSRAALALVKSGDVLRLDDDTGAATHYLARSGDIIRPDDATSDVPVVEVGTAHLLVG